MITNSGSDRQTVCWEYHKYAERVLQGVLEDDSFFAFVAGLDKGDDWRDEAVWEKANPLLDVSITRKYLREQVRRAVGMPAKQSIVRRLNFCEWTEGEAGWLAKEGRCPGRPRYSGLPRLPMLWRGRPVTQTRSDRA